MIILMVFAQLLMTIGVLSLQLVSRSAVRALVPQLAVKVAMIPAKVVMECPVVVVTRIHISRLAVSYHGRVMTPASVLKKSTESSASDGKLKRVRLARRYSGSQKERCQN
jgi:hypothetical protein